MRTLMELRADNDRARWGDLRLLVDGPLTEKVAVLGRLGLRFSTGAVTGAAVYLGLADEPTAGWAAIGRLTLRLCTPVLRAVGWTGDPTDAALGSVLTAATLGVAASLAAPSIIDHLGALFPQWGHRVQRARTRSLQLYIPPNTGTSLRIEAHEADALYPFYVQLRAQVGTLRLRVRNGSAEEDIGDIGLALRRLDGLNAALRAALPTDPQNGAPSAAAAAAASTVLESIDGAVAPVVARWKPHWERWSATSIPEARWPLAKDCRADVEAGVSACQHIADALGAIFGALVVADADAGHRGPAASPDLTPHHPFLHTPIGWGSVADTRWRDIHRTLCMGLGGVESPRAVPVGAAALRSELATWTALCTATEAALAAFPHIPAEALLRVSEDDVLERRPDDALLGYLRVLRAPLAFLPEGPGAPGDDSSAADLNDIADLLNEAREKLRGLLLQRPGADDHGALPSRRAP
jgi:hypothetical protein